MTMTVILLVLAGGSLAAYLIRREPVSMATENCTLRGESCRAERTFSR